METRATPAERATMMGVTPHEPSQPAEVVLSGGFVNRVVRVGDTVRRPCGTWTPAVHALLRHLEVNDFGMAPRVLGVDEQGREVLTFIEGTPIGWTDWPSVMRSNDGVIQLARVLRRYHDAVRSFVPAPDASWRNPLAPTAGEVVRHGDFSPFNSIWSNGQLVGVIDWDFAQPGYAISDLAYLAWYAVPLAGERRTNEYGFHAGIDRAERLGVLCEAYGRYAPGEVVDEAVRIIEVECTQMQHLASQGLEPWASFVADGNLKAFSAETAWIRRNRRLFLTGGPPMLGG